MPVNESTAVALKMGCVLDELLGSISALTIAKLGRTTSNGGNSWRELSAMLAFEIRSCPSYPSNEILRRDFWKRHKTTMPAHYQLYRVLRALEMDMDFWARLLDYRAELQARSGCCAGSEAEVASAAVEPAVPSKEEPLLEEFAGLHAVDALQYATLDVALAILESLREAYGRQTTGQRIELERRADSGLTTGQRRHREPPQRQDHTS